MLSQKIHPRAGMVLEYRRRFTRAEILQFAELSGDRGEHHVSGERLIVHGLLVASIVTKLGGDLDYVSRDMQMEFLEPVYEDEWTLGVLTIEEALERPQRIKIRMRCEVLRKDGTCVLRGTSRGQIRRRNSGA
jgi:3-hydroxybutyryl-CoA dehydratase